MRATIREHEDIARFDIAVDESVFVGFAECPADLPQNVDDAFGRLRAVPTDEIFETQPGQVFHHIVKGAIFRDAVIVDLDGVRVSQLGGGLHFAFEPLELFGVVQILGVNPLEGAGPFEQAVLGEIDFAHAAGTEFAAQAILAHLSHGGAGRLHFALQGHRFCGAEDRQSPAGGQDGATDGKEDARIPRDRRVNAHGHRVDRQCRHAHGDSDADAARDGVRDQHRVEHDQQKPVEVAHPRRGENERLFVATTFKPGFGAGRQDRELPVSEEERQLTEDRHF